MESCYEQQTFLESLYTQYKAMMLKVVHKYVSDINAREDVFQEAFIRLIRNESTLRDLPSYKLEAFIVLTIRYAAIDYYRKSHQDVTIDISDDVLLNMLGQQTREEASRLDDYGKVELVMMMNQLSAEERILIVGRYYLGLNIEELSGIVGGSAPKVRSQLFRAKKRLFLEWKKSGLEMEDFLNE